MNIYQICSCRQSLEGWHGLSSRSLENHHRQGGKSTVGVSNKLLWQTMSSTILYNISCEIYSICTIGGDLVKAHLNEVDINPVLRKGDLGEISLQEKQETQEEKTFPETFLAVADRVFSRQGIARSILIQTVLVRIMCISIYCILIQADKLGIFENTYLFPKLRAEDCSCRRLGSPRSGWQPGFFLIEQLEVLRRGKWGRVKNRHLPIMFIHSCQEKAENIFEPSLIATT